LAHEQEGAVDEAFRIALRVLGERAVLVEKMALDALRAGRTMAAASFEERVKEYRHAAAVLMDTVLKDR
jgi:two-component system chemotaxis response regulator CheB